MKQLYVTYCTEYERDELGCSQRSDGLAISEDLEKLKAYIKEFSTGSPDYYWRYSDPSIIYTDARKWKTLSKKSRNGIVRFDRLPEGFYKEA
jgi:hypothetical protein